MVRGRRDTKVLGGWSQVPNSNVNNGKANLDDVNADNQNEARLAVRDKEI